MIWKGAFKSRDVIQHDEQPTSKNNIISVEAFEYWHVSVFVDSAGQYFEWEVSYVIVMDVLYMKIEVSFMCKYIKNSIDEYTTTWIMFPLLLWRDI